MLGPHLRLLLSVGVLEPSKSLCGLNNNADNGALVPVFTSPRLLRLCLGFYAEAQIQAVHVLRHHSLAAGSAVYNVSGLFLGSHRRLNNKTLPLVALAQI